MFIPQGSKLPMSQMTQLAAVLELTLSGIEVGAAVAGEVGVLALVDPL